MFVLDVEVAVFNDDQIHVLEYAYGHEDKGVAHGLAYDAVLLCSVLEGDQNGVTVHHTEERIHRIAKVIKEVTVVPED